MRNGLSFAFALALGIPAAAGAQAVSPYLFGQNYWMEQGTEGGRPGYLHLLWPRVAQSGVRLIRIGGNGYEHGFPDEKRLVAMIAAVRAAGAEPLLQVPSRLGAAEAEALVAASTRRPRPASDSGRSATSRCSGSPTSSGRFTPT